MTPPSSLVTDILRALGMVLLLGAALGARAATADISNSPLANQTAGSVRANLLFVLDDSGSMGFNYMPDDIASDAALRCFGYLGNNKIFYNPNYTYLAPLTSAGVSVGDASFTAAKIDGYSANSATRDLSNPDTGLAAVDGNDIGNPSVVLATTPGTPATTVTGPTICGKSNATACSTTPTTTTTRTGNVITTTTVTKVRGNAPGKTCNTTTANSCTLTTTTTTTPTNITKEGRFYWATLKANATNDCQDTSYDVVYDPNSLTAAQKTNYANWYTYYRTRMLMMRGAAGRVFNNIDPTLFRVGFTTISENGVADNAKFLNINDFNQTQKTTFFSKLYATVPSGSTPLRPSLIKAGRYFAKKVAGQTKDPVQYSCQRNYTILSTDGYWNTPAEPAAYVPMQLNGTTPIGNQDAGKTERPMLDDGQTVGGSWTTGGPGVSNSLADIAQYYYVTDLRSPALNNCSGSVANQDVCDDTTLKTVGKDTQHQQHMTTFTLGLGIDGILNYQPDYETATSGDFFNVRNGSIPWPNPKSDTSAGLADPSSTVVARIDDLWHAAVNGRGTYYSASNPQDLATSLTDALSKIASQSGTGAAAATSSLKPTQGDNFLYQGQYTTQEWSGNVRALSINTATGNISSTAMWEAKDTLKAQVQSTSDTRTIYFFNATATNKLQTFTYANLNSAGLGANFANLCQAGNYKLSQCATVAGLGATSVNAANSGTNVVNFLRGQTQYEQITTNAPASQLFRPRTTTPLGDVIDAAPVYVHKSPFSYTDSGYAGFKGGTASRRPVVYVASNDGMLHAFAGDTGAELWAYVPSTVMPNLYLLADAQYASKHQYFVDGTPTIGDVFDGSKWRTILVGGLNGGGRGYYALDVTDPNNPIGLWEFSSSNDADLGLSYGNPVVAKNKAGTWFVAFSSGYNNVTPGDGNGHLFLLNAVTGVSIAKLNTYTSGTIAAGTTGAPSNLGRIEGWVDKPSDNTAKRFYGGDMLGNVWRFDYDKLLSATVSVTPIGQAQSPTGAVQPITTKPELALVGNGTGDVPAVIVGTGRYLGATDVGDSTVQSIYVIKDDLALSSLGVLRKNTGMKFEAMTTSGATRTTASPVKIDWQNDKGWYVDLSLSPGERINVDMLQTGTLLVAASNIPAATVCTPGGTSLLYQFDLGTGTLTSVTDSPAMSAGINIVYLNNKSIIYDSRVDSTIGVIDVKRGGGGNPPGTVRSSWRELID